MFDGLLASWLALSSRLTLPHSRDSRKRDSAIAASAAPGFLCRTLRVATSAIRAETSMLDAAIKALSQMFSPPFRTVLLKAIGLALLLIVVLGFGLYRALIWLAAFG